MITFITSGSTQSAIASIYYRDSYHRVVSGQPRLRQLCELAIQHGAELDDWSEEYAALGDEQREWTMGPTPLHSLAAWGVVEGKNILKAEMQYLVDKGFDINEANENGITPLLNSMQWGYPEVTRLETFLEAGADAAVLDTDGCNALQLVLDSLDCISSSYIRMIDEYQQTLPALFKTLIKHGCMPDHVNKRGVSVSMRMRHTVAGDAWDIWISVLRELDLLHCVDTEDIEDVRLVWNSHRCRLLMYARLSVHVEASVPSARALP